MFEHEEPCINKIIVVFAWLLSLIDVISNLKSYRQLASPKYSAKVRTFGNRARFRES